MLHVSASLWPISPASHVCACRHIGVERVLLYVDDKEPKPQTEALQQYPGDFLVWKSLQKRGANEDEAYFVRRKCVQENAKDIAYISFLHTYDYIMPRGPGKNKQNQLKQLLKSFEYRFGPGELLCLFLCLVLRPLFNLAGSW